MTTNNKKKLKQILSTYTKDEIISAVIDSVPEFNIGQLKHLLYQGKTERLLKEIEKEQKEETIALRKLIDFQHELAQKYGDGEKFDMNKLTQEEFAKYRLLNLRFQSKQRSWINLNKKLDKQYEVNIEQ